MLLLRAIGRLIFWDYTRGSWQHEVLCLVYIAALIFIPANSNGWFSEGERAELPDGAFITLHRYDTHLYISWPEGGREPGAEELEHFVRERFGEDAVLVRETEDERWRFRIIPRGLQ